jgi:putative NADPH-quinone reductase
MHVMAINGSPRNETSSTNHILTPLLEGMRSAGATTEVVHLGKLQIKHCLGCFLCWIRTPGKCAQKDDMNEVFERFIQADLLVFGTPLYHYHMSGLLKNFIDRTLPMHEPWLLEDPGHSSWSKHPDRYPRERSMLVVSPCGFPEFDYFVPMVQYFQFLAQKTRWRYLGEILRPEGEVLRTPECQEMIAWYYDLLRQAGGELIREGRISPELQISLRRDLTPGGPEAFRQMANKQWLESMRKFGVSDCPPECTP